MNEKFELTNDFGGSHLCCVLEQKLDSISIIQKNKSDAENEGNRNFQNGLRWILLWPTIEVAK